MDTHSWLHYYDDIPLNSPYGDGLNDLVPGTGMTNYDQMQQILQDQGLNLVILHANSWGKVENSINARIKNTSASFIVGMYLADQ